MKPEALELMTRAQAVLAKHGWDYTFCMCGHTIVYDDRLYSRDDHALHQAAMLIVEIPEFAAVRDGATQEWGLGTELADGSHSLIDGSFQNREEAVNSKFYSSVHIISRWVTSWKAT